MYGAEVSIGSLWWLFPGAMIVLCFLMMRGGRWRDMCGFGSHGGENSRTGSSQSARDVLDKRYARGEIDEVEYERKKRDIART